MQPLPSLPVDGVLDITASNHSQQRGAHGLFRYFGKLAPDVTGTILDIAAGHSKSIRNGPVVDLMCGSGTTLIEASERGWGSVGIEVNPVSVLYSLVKTTPVSAAKVERLLTTTLEVAELIDPSKAELVFEQTHNSERWFTDIARLKVGSLRLAIGQLPASSETNVLLSALLSRLRKISNASAKTGRIFYDPKSADRNIVDGFVESVRRVVHVAPKVPLLVKVILSDARATGLPDCMTNLVFCHPPYFALYRFSSDVLRFELEVGGWNRNSIVPMEVREGWKSGDPRKLDDHVEDMGRVFEEARRISKLGGVFALVTSNSTLGDREMPVIDRLASVAEDKRWSVVSHLERTAHFGAATYHKSARNDKVIQRDHILFFRAV